MAKLEVVFDHDEIQKEIPYSLICMTRESSVWDTGKRRRRWVQEFTKEERDAACRIFTLAHRWTLTTGVPEKVRMSLKTYELWDKIAVFCASL